MKWATRAGIHIDRTDVPADATPFDMRGVDLGHHGADCSFETIREGLLGREPA